MDIISQVKAARRAATPLIAINAADPIATIEKLSLKVYQDFPILEWDIQRGLRPRNDLGAELLRFFDPTGKLVEQSGEPTVALRILAGEGGTGQIPEDFVVFFHNGHRLLEHLTVVQGLLNLRDPYKLVASSIVLVGPYFELPNELVFNVVVFNDEVPNDDQINRIIDDLHETVKLPKPTGDERQRAIDATRGLAAYTIEQNVARALTPDGLALDSLWEFKRDVVRQTQGLAMPNNSETYADVGGIQAAKAFMRRLMDGPERPSAIVFIDEIDKSMGGSHSNDAHATERDQLGALLRFMNDEDMTGIIAFGVPGCSKSLFAKSTGRTFGIPTIEFDISAMKGGIVGSTEAATRQALQVVKGLGGSRTFFIAAANRLDSMPGELLRRFADGIWFFDLPDEEELEAIWQINLNRYHLDLTTEYPRDVEYTGADVRNICRAAYRQQLTLAEAAQLITPISVGDPGLIERQRDQAHEVFTSASKPGKYRKKDRVVPMPNVSTKRRLNV